MEKVSIDQLIANVLLELERLNYSDNSICGFKAIYKKVVDYAKEKDIIYFSEQFGRDFLKEKYNTEINYYTESMPKKLKNPIRKIRVLGDYQLHGVILRRMSKKVKYVKPKQFEEVLLAYEKECTKNEYSLRGLRTRIQRLYLFIDYLDAKNINSVNEITPEIISDYVKTIYSKHEKSIAAILTTLRVFLRFLYLNKFTNNDLSEKVPKQKKYYYPAIPSTWLKEEVIKLLNVVDKGNPTGKRDYAILLLVTRLGIRVGDIVNLQLSDLDWKHQKINIIQSKTKSSNSFPILDDIGWALIDYLQNGRPISDSPYVFLRSVAPFERFGENANLHNIISKYTRKAGIKIPKGKRHGLHSLTHTLAGTLLEQGTPLPVISEILGHINSKTTQKYLQIGIDQLRKCSLDPDEVMKNG